MYKIGFFRCLGIVDKIDPQIGADFFVRLRQQTERIAKAM